jgi:hypothetical protein
MSSEMGHREAPEIERAASDDPRLWDEDLSTGTPWQPLAGGPPLGEDAFPVEWQLSPDEEPGPSATQTSRDEKARMFENRLLRLYRQYYPPPQRP